MEVETTAKAGKKEEPKTYRFRIDGSLIGFNQYDAIRKSEARHEKKSEMQDIVRMYIRKAKLRGIQIQRPVFITYVWVEKDRRRDKDNVAFAKKFIQDALVQEKVLINDTWRYIEGFCDYLAVDPQYPRIEVEIREVV